MTLPLSAERSESSKALAQDPLLEREAEVAALAALLDAARSRRWAACRGRGQRRDRQDAATRPRRA